MHFGVAFCVYCSTLCFVEHRAAAWAVIFECSYDRYEVAGKGGPFVAAIFACCTGSFAAVGHCLTCNPCGKATHAADVLGGQC